MIQPIWFNRWNHQSKPTRRGVVLPDIENFDMIVFDVDGTLLDSNGYQPKLIPLIRKLEDSGIKISLASGRTLPNVTPIQQSLATSGFVIGENGGMVWDTKEGFPIRKLANGLRAKEAAYWLSTKIPDLDPAGIESNRWRETEWCLNEMDNLQKIKETISDSDYSDLSVVPTGFAIHLCTPGLDKSSGLKVAFSQRDIDPSRVIAVGDAANDIPMFQLCGFAVAVNDNDEQVVGSADHITQEKGTLGTIEFLEQLLR